MRHLFLLVFLSSTFSTTSWASNFNFQIGAYAWQQSISGDITIGEFSTDVDLENDLGFDDETNNTFYISIEHSIPIIPNIFIQKTDLDLSASGNASIIFNGFSLSGPVRSNIDLSHTDITFYYQVLKKPLSPYRIPFNEISMSIGATARLVDDVSLEATDVTRGRTESIDTNGVLPLLYIAARIELPSPGLYLGADISGLDDELGINDVSLFDYRVNLGYENRNGLGIEAGYRRLELNYDKSDDKADVTVDGAYLGIFYRF